MLTTARACVPITISRQEIERWPNTPSARVLTDEWSRSRTITFRLPAVDRAVPVCRYLTRSWLDQQHLTDEDIRHTALLIATELATNAIVHTGSTVIRANLQRNRNHLRIQVRDQGTVNSAKHWHNASGFGRGLGIVASSARALGTRIERDGTRSIWATVPLA
ncbi:ATP-binding protein [Streptomyces sp. NPDC086549]|uniref:ATP-binding protein n=1 Tax=Streptomyces sp. NPDC086549 TaxID=3365752 RepID=UPI0038259E7D